MLNLTELMSEGGNIAIKGNISCTLYTLVDYLCYLLLYLDGGTDLTPIRTQESLQLIPKL